ncbi:MAG: DMT family transporter [Acidibacillus sp.]|nr:DMT family transporter [Acidibacillus sp.]
MVKRYMADSVLLLITFVWGTTFVLVQNAIRMIPVFSFLAIRFCIAGALLLVISLLYKPWRKAYTRRLLLAGFLIGTWLFSGYAFQTLGLLYVSPATAGFITGLSVVLVPLFSIVLLKRKPSKFAWIGVLMATIGLFLLAFGQSNHLNGGDLLELLCAVSFAMQIITVGKHAPKYPALPLAAIQIVTVGILSVLVLLATHSPIATSNEVLLAPTVQIALWVCILFATVIAYFAQTAFQKFTTPTRTALIFSMEPVFAALAAYLWTKQRLGQSELVGCGLILLGMLVTEFGGQDHTMTSTSSETI